MADGDIRILESFDRYADFGSVGRMDSVWEANLGFVPGRYFGGRAVRMQGSGNGGSAYHTYIDDRLQAFTIGCAINPESRSSNTLLSATGPNGNITLGHGDNGRLNVARRAYGAFGWGSDWLGDGIKVDAIVQNVWQYVEFQVVQVGNVGTIKAWVNGELCMNLVDMPINHPAGFDGFGIAHILGPGFASYDDFYVREGPNKLGEIKIESIVPDGVLSNTMDILVGAASANAAVSEMPVDGDTSYVASNDVGDGVRFTYGNLTTVPDAIRAVQVRAYARKDETAYRSFKNVVNSGGVEASGREQVLGTGYKFFKDIFPLNPQTGAAWTQAAVNGFAAGIDLFA